MTAMFYPRSSAQIRGRFVFVSNAEKAPSQGCLSLQNLDLA